MSKIKMINPLVEMDGDEMTRVIWGMIKEELLNPFIDLKTEYYDLGIEKRNETVFLSAMRLLHEKKNRMCAMLICHFVFPSYATTSPMRIATIHSVHLPLFLDFVGIYFIPTGHSNCFYTKNQFLFCYLPDFSPDFFRFLSISLHSCHFSVGK